MRIAALLTPVAEWPAIIEAAHAADAAGLDAVGFWDHYHSAQPDWAYVAGWSAFGAIAARTERVRLLPMVLNNLHYEPGVLAKESSILARLSGGRFELGIGAGDWPASFDAWGRPFPPVDERLDRLVETVEALRLLWTGTPTSYAGRHVRLDGAICTPAPTAAPRVVVGAGGSRRALERAIPIADEVNVYDDRTLIAEARQRLADSGRPTSLSVFLSWEWDQWPQDPGAALDALADLGIDRVCVSLGSDQMVRRIEVLARWSERHRA
jgi:alkanesulfonate monooxygenase SsuD/methylene tetrahydromethanopterin reductase-like flavin-dependent oxidoreductase (luciferase family)